MRSSMMMLVILAFGLLAGCTLNLPDRSPEQPPGDVPAPAP